jgi:Ca2+-transporting ATPase
MTLFFITLIFSRLFNGFNCRSMEDSIFHLGLFSNKPLIYSTLVALSMTIAVLLIPVLHEPFRVVFLHRNEWLIAIGASAIILITAEIQKAFYRKFRRVKISRSAAVGN